MDRLTTPAVGEPPNTPRHTRNFGEFVFSASERSFFDGTAPAETRAHRSDSQHQRILLRHCYTLQPLVARQCRGRGFGIESTADVLLTKPSTRTSWFSRFY